MPIGVRLNKTTRGTRSCTVETQDEKLKVAIRVHGAKYGLQDLDSDVLMCCETISARQKKGFLGGIQTTLSAVFVTPKWLVWAASSREKDANAGAAQLKHIDVSDTGTTASYSLTHDQGLNVTARYTNRNRIGITFIMLNSEAEGQKFRGVLQGAMLTSRAD